jgi:hypothetical protein
MKEPVQEELFTPIKHKLQISDSPEMDPPLKPADKTLLSKVTKDGSVARVEEAKKAE